MRVLIDEQIFLMHSRGGISRYFAELLRQFRQHPEWGIQAHTTVTRTTNEHLREVDASVGELLLPSPDQSVGWKAQLRALRLLAARREQAWAPQLIHYSFYDPWKLTRFGDIPSVVTIHDMAPELLSPDVVNPAAHRAKREYVAHADAIICVSQSTRDDLFAVWGEITDRPVIVTGHAVSSRFHPADNADDAATGARSAAPYVLYVGERSGYKDFPVLMRGFAGSSLQRNGATLVAVGGGALTADEVALADELGITGQLVQRGATDEELPALYRGAVTYAYPSRFEGFGIPIVEAMSSGCPVVLADIPVFHEVAGPAALYHRPGDSDQLRDALDRIAGNQSLRSELVDAGLARAREFSWEATAAATAELYRQVLDTRFDSGSTPDG